MEKRKIVIVHFKIFMFKNTCSGINVTETQSTKADTGTGCQAVGCAYRISTKSWVVCYRSIRSSMLYDRQERMYYNRLCTIIDKD